MPQVKLIPGLEQEKNDEEIIIPESAAKLSAVLEMMLMTGTDDGEVVAAVMPEIPIPDASHATLKKVAQFLTQYEKEPFPTPYVRHAESAWYVDFVEALPYNGPETALFQVLKTAHFLGIQPLTDLLCNKLVLLIQTNTPSELASLLNVPGDFTDEEVQEAQRKYTWLAEYEDK